MMQSKFVVGLILFVTFSLPTNVFPGSELDRKSRPFNENISRDLSHSTLFNINNISGWIASDGWSGRHPISGNPGVLYPRGTANVIFQDGLIWGGIVQDTVSELPKLRVGGQHYVIGTIPGPIPTVEDFRIYRIRRDWQTMTEDELRKDAAEYFSVEPDQVTQEQMEKVRSQYEADWESWPVEFGAPFYDLNGNGKFEPSKGEMPGLANADQVIWTVFNDLDAGTVMSLVGSPPIGLEVQVTIWGYKSEGPLGQMVFQRYRIINESDYSIDSMFVARWSDTDIGDFGNDFAGCDTLLDLGFAYNGEAQDDEFLKYDLPPAAVGYRLVQGPIVPAPGETAYFDLEQIIGFKNLPMTAFPYSATGLPSDNPIIGDYEGTLEWYNQLNGFSATPDTAYPAPYLRGDDTTNSSFTKFPVSGDPITGQGDVDGQGRNMPPGGREVRMTSGPFNMQPGDTQEVVFALIGGLGNNRLTSVEVLKYNALFANYYHKNHFQIPETPPTPRVLTSASNGRVVLDWGSDLESLKQIEENTLQADYRFEGYNVWQLPNKNASLDEAVRIATFDKETPPAYIFGKKIDPQTILIVDEVLAFGTNSGLQRYFFVDEDHFTGHPLIDGKVYYFAITAYYYDDDPNNPLPVKESPLVHIPVTAQGTNPGYAAGAGDTLAVNHSRGNSTGRVTAIVVNPGELMGHQYQITFPDNRHWLLKDLSTGIIKLDNQSSSNHLKPFPIIDGMLFKVVSPIESFYGGYDFTGERWIFGVTQDSKFGPGISIPALNPGWFELPNLQEEDLVPVRLEFQDDTTSGPADGWASKGAVYRRDLGFEYAGTGYLPFAAYDIHEPENPRQVNVCFVEDNDIAPANKRWDMGWLTTINPETGENRYPDDLGAREYFFVMLSDYDEGALYDEQNLGFEADVLYGYWPRGVEDSPYLNSKFYFEIYYHQPADSEDVFTFTAPAPPNVPNQFRLYQNFPNPFNAATTIRYWIPQSSHVKLDIFNLLGQKVATLVNRVQEQGEYFIHWQPQDKASGVYVVRLQSGRKVKVRKMVVVR